MIPDEDEDQESVQHRLGQEIPRIARGIARGIEQDPRRGVERGRLKAKQDASAGRVLTPHEVHLTVPAALVNYRRDHEPLEPTS